jgi:hypothetical protein
MIIAFRRVDAGAPSKEYKPSPVGSGRKTDRKHTKKLQVIQTDIPEFPEKLSSSDWRPWMAITSHFLYQRVA